MPLPQLSDRPTVTEVRSALEQAGHDYAALRNRPASERGENYNTDVQEHGRFIRDADLILTALERGAPVLPDPGTGILPPGARPGPSAATQAWDNRTLGEQVTDTDDYRNFATSRASSTTYHEHQVRGSLFNGDWQARALIDSDDPGGGSWRPVGQPIPPTPRRMRFFLRDILNVQQTTLASIPYIREVNPVGGEGGASAVAEGSAKPEVAMDWTIDDAPVRKIAAWVPVTTEIIDDAPTLMGYINGRLTYLLAVREEQLILNGTGTTPQIKGILQYSDVQSQAFSSSKMASLGLAIGKVEVVDGDADGIAMRPEDYWSMVTTRFADQFDGGGGGPLPYSPAGGLSPWGLPCVRSRALTLNQAVVGSWGLGATLFDRQQTTIRVGNQHSDYFTLNKVVVLVEERVALAVHRPDFFVKVTLS